MLCKNVSRFSSKHYKLTINLLIINRFGCSTSDVRFCESINEKMDQHRMSLLSAFPCLLSFSSFLTFLREGGVSQGSLTWLDAFPALNGKTTDREEGEVESNVTLLLTK